MAQSPDLSPQIFRPYTIDTGTYLLAPEGLLLSELVIGTAAVKMDILDPPEGHLALFAKHDIVRVRALGRFQGSAQNDSATTFAHEFWAVGAVPSTMLLDVWLQVTAVNDLGTHFRYTVRRRGPAVEGQYAFTPNTLVIGYGPVDNRLVQLRATRNRTPQIDVFTTGVAPWNGSDTQVRLGRLDDLDSIEGEQVGLAAGANLNATGSAHVRVSDQGVHLSQLDLTLDDGDQSTVQLGGDGAFKVGGNLAADASTAIAYDPQSDALTVRASLQTHGPIASHGGLSVNNADVTTIALTPAGELKMGANVNDADLVDLAYAPLARTVHIRNAQIADAQIASTQIGNATIASAQLENAQIKHAQLVDAEVSGGLVHRGGLQVNNADVTTIVLTPTGELKVGADVNDADLVDLAYEPLARTVHIRNAQIASAQIEDAKLTDVEVTGDLTSQGDITLINNGAATVKLGSNGDVRIGSDLEPAQGLLFDLQVDAGALAISAVITLQKDALFAGDATFQGAIVSNGALRFQTGAVTKAQIDSAGGLSLGPDIDRTDSIDLSYSPTSRRVEIRDAQIRNAQIADIDVIDIKLSGSLSGHGEIKLTNADAPTVRLGSNGDVQFGPNLTEIGGARFDFQADAGALALHTVTTLHGRTLFQGNTRFEGEVTAGGEITLEGETIARNTVKLLDDGALVVGETESIRMDGDGITMRLEPGEHNAVQVLGIGRAAMLNAYQTAQGGQQFDMLAYYSADVPSLHGGLLMGVANVNGNAPDLFMRMTRFVSGVRRIDIQSSLLDIQSGNIQLNGETSINGNFEFSGTGTATRVFRLRNLPTKADGLPTGAVWNNQGTLSIIQ